MHTVLCFLEYSRLRRFKYFIGYFHLIQAVAVVDLFSDLCFQIVEGRQAVQEHGGIFCICHCFFCDTVRSQIVDSLLPYAVRLTHRYPDIGIDNIGIFCSLFYVLGEGDGCTALLCILLTLSHKLCVREVFLRCTGHKIHSHLGRCNHQGISHIVTGVAHVNEFNAF